MACTKMTLAVEVSDLLPINQKGQCKGQLSELKTRFMYCIIILRNLYPHFFFLKEVWAYGDDHREMNGCLKGLHMYLFGNWNQLIVSILY